MVDLSKNRRIFLRPGYTDMRLGVMGLSNLIGKPETGCAYTFCGAKGRMVKIIEYEGQSIWLHIKKAPLLAMTALMALSMFALFRTSSRRLMRLSFSSFPLGFQFPYAFHRDVASDCHSYFDGCLVQPFPFRVLWPLLTPRRVPPPRPHGVNPRPFPKRPPNLRCRLTLWALSLFADSPLRLRLLSGSCS